MENNYKPNSFKSKSEIQDLNKEKKVEKIVTGSVKAKKKNKIQRLADIFISEDVESVKSYILLDVLVPAIKKAISDIVTIGIDMILNGGSEKTREKPPSARVSYGGFYERESSRRKEYGYSGTRAGYNYGEIILDNRMEAKEVLSKMDELISTYGLVSVADLYDLVGISGNYTDNKYGWTDIRSARILPVEDGYIIKLPKAMPLN